MNRLLWIALAGLAWQVAGAEQPVAPTPGTEAVAGNPAGAAIIAATDGPADAHVGHTAPVQSEIVSPSQTDKESATRAGQDMAAVPGTDTLPAGADRSALVAPDRPPPSPPNDYVADRFFDVKRMDAARAQLRAEHGASRVAMFLLNQAEYRSANGGGYGWDGEIWYGGDINRLIVKSEGDGSPRKGLEQGELQAAYGRAISPFFNMQLGVRHDFRPTPSRTFAMLGMEGVARYWFRTDTALFFSSQGELFARLKGSYDLRLTQRLIVQPELELNLSAQEVRELGLGSGATDMDAGIRLRYEIRREFAPYIGVNWVQELGRTADFTRMRGDSTRSTSLVLGVRAWL